MKGRERAETVVQMRQEKRKRRLRLSTGDDGGTRTRCNGRDLEARAAVITEVRLSRSGSPD